ncbi:site-specific recombinase XerD domain protein [Mycobacterium intracellulare MIN_061107_1834]|nr:site-specific recombinase XerD domain protein [Mycobacterium intracellulare MIN_061107_1834]
MQLGLRERTPFGRDGIIGSVLRVFHSKQICDGTSPNCFSQNATQPYRLSLT